jgi:hypothetical protein
LKERIWQRIQGWKEKLLSRAGKEILIKAVAQAIRVFAMGCFDITKEMCNQISAMIVKYWWTNQDKEKCMLSWEKLVKPKAEGGLGFRDLHSFNMAMLAKQGWRILHNPNLHSFNMAMLAKQGWRIQHNPNTLCAQILEAKYFPNTSLLQAKMRDGCSYTWRSIFQGKRA